MKLFVMKHAVCQLSIVPVRNEPSDKSEMVNQLLFGDPVKILEKRSKWSRIRMSYDRYEGWVDNKQLHFIDKDVYEELVLNEGKVLTDEMVQLLEPEGNGAFPVLFGSSLYHFSEGQTSLNGQSYKINGAIRMYDQKTNREQLVEDALSFMGAPYLWGGRTPFGIDCSGYTQMVYKLNGIKLPRDAYQQAEKGQPLSFIEEAKPGDLAFFDNEEGKIIHVGIILSDNRIIHASGVVRMDKIDHQGIFVGVGEGYSHKLRIIRNLIDEN